ncbi:hypothetical protein SB30_200095 [Klebsiella quasipneumoniae subsp. similipneumoniae]|nr:hypothetical protein SB30_200095 [Klebsiella quasipneumoniae subsp. similipneumoniae]
MICLSFHCKQPGAVKQLILLWIVSEGRFYVMLKESKKSKDSVCRKFNFIWSMLSAIKTSVAMPRPSAPSASG